MQNKIRPKKSLGQNFLKDEKVVDKIVQALELDQNDQVLEIGPGTGVLTRMILPWAKKLIIIEKDNQLAGSLIEKFDSEKKIEIINADFLDLDFDNIVGNGRDLSLQRNLKIVGNLPYNQAKPILRKILEHAPANAGVGPKLIVVMLQKEVAEKILDYEKGSILGLMTQFFAEIKPVINVSKEAFSPKPKVDSQVIKLIPRKDPLIDFKNQKKFFDFIKKGFRHPRKKLLNNLENISEINLEKIGLKETVRPEELTLKQWLKLFKSS
ncbi:16S rRNA (adenine(1518)-N(6)/adenine(1519)-N(6))-dimethyltransferase RsmA [Patescibacteria group bacterium]